MGSATGQIIDGYLEEIAKLVEKEELQLAKQKILQVSQYSNEFSEEQKGKYYELNKRATVHDVA